MLHAVSYLAPNSFTFYQSVTAALARSLSVEITFHQSMLDPLEDPEFMNSQLDLAFICGLPFIRHHQRYPDQFQVLAAPVMQAQRYCDRPIYFSDLIVNRASSVHQVSDLSGKIFGYNDQGSNSGYYVMKWYLAKHNYPNDFFSDWVETSSHQHSLHRVLEGSIDSAALDSIVLERSLQIHPEWKDAIRVIQTIGPSPIPPIIVATHLGEIVIHKLRTALRYPDHGLRIAMKHAGIHHYIEQTWQDYKILVERYEYIL